MRVFFVTGSSRGIGLGLVKHILERNTVDKVVATARNPEKSAELMTFTQAYRERLVVLPLDVTNQASHRQAKDLLVQRGVTSIDVLVANAGVMNNDRPRNDFFTCTPEEMDGVWRTNVSGVLLTLQHFSELLLNSQHKIAVVMSTYLGSIQSAAKATDPGYTCYRTSKAGVNMLAMSYATDPKVKAAGGKVLCMHPGWVQTDMGGAGAPLSVSQSAANMLWTIDHACEVTSGTGTEHRSAFKDKLAAEDCVFVTHDGRLLPW
eukprot:gene25664-30996_t